MSKEATQSYKGIENVVPPNSVARWGWEKVRQRYLEGIEYDGVENLGQARRLASETGAGIAFVGNHLSNADWFVFKAALQEQGVADADGGFVPILGKRLYNHPVTRVACYAAPHIKIWPPTEAPANQQEEDEARSMNFSALKASRKVIKEGQDILLFPQGGREEHEIKRIPAPQVSGFLDQGVVVPFGMLADKILKKGQWIPRRNKASINFGTPIRAQDLDKLFEVFGKDDKRLAKGIYVMTLIADLVPEDYRGVYGHEVRLLREGATPAEIVQRKIEWTKIDASLRGEGEQ